MASAVRLDVLRRNDRKRRLTSRLHVPCTTRALYSSRRYCISARLVIVRFSRSTCVTSVVDCKRDSIFSIVSPYLADRDRMLKADWSSRFIPFLDSLSLYSGSSLILDSVSFKAENSPCRSRVGSPACKGRPVTGASWR